MNIYNSAHGIWNIINLRYFYLFDAQSRGLIVKEPKGIPDNLSSYIYKFAFEGDILWDLVKPNGTHQRKLDISLMNILGWSHKISLIDGIKKPLNNILK